MSDDGVSPTPRLESTENPDVPQGLTTIGGRSAYIALFSQIGITLLVANLGGALLGNWVDEGIGTRPLFLIAGFLGGFAVGAVGAARLVRRALRMFEALDEAAAKKRLEERLAREQERRGQ
ncbi:MAG: putative F0F1-ATPase subunit Ca2+/Mg2+ transporter [Chloroflexota bacterium]|jgi:F0F1-type ATP synthase assembly protein I